ncbi:MAG: hypothetical protein AAF721_01095 [Myxococcota bacterium]
MRCTLFCRGLVATALMGLSACVQPDISARPQTSEVTPRWHTLTNPAAWRVAEADDDPLEEHRPSPLVCSPQPWHAVAQGIEADTSECNYVHLTTPLTADIDEGDPIAVDVWWNALASVAPAEGHLALFIGGQAVWETHVEIPGPADAQQFEFPSPFSAFVGEDVTFHLHNHGFNTWTLARFAVLNDQEPTQP